jgi:hypothetical protein
LSSAAFFSLSIPDESTSELSLGLAAIIAVCSVAWWVSPSGVLSACGLVE